MMSLQIIPLGTDRRPFQEYPGDANFVDQSVLESEYGGYNYDNGDNDGLIVEDVNTMPYYIGLLRKR